MRLCDAWCPINKLSQSFLPISNFIISTKYIKLIFYTINSDTKIRKLVNSSLSQWWSSGPSHHGRAKVADWVGLAGAICSPYKFGQGEEIRALLTTYFNLDFPLGLPFPIFDPRYWFMQPWAYIIAIQLEIKLNFLSIKSPLLSSSSPQQ